MAHLSRRVRRLVTIPRLTLLALLVGLLAAPVAAAHEREGTAIHRVAITAHDNGTNGAGFKGSFSLPSKVPTGLVEFRFVNGGSTDHMAQLFRLNPGVSESQFLTKLAAVSGTPAQTAAGLRALLAISSAAGGDDSITPGAAQDVIEWLRPGHYVVVCFDTTTTNVPHFLLGMFKGFWARDDAKAPLDRDDRVSDGTPRSNGTVLEFDHQINVPAVIHESERLLLRINVRDQSHELQLLRVPAGTTKAGLLSCFTGGPCTLTAPPIDSGGAGAIAPGSTHWVELHLAPGTYAAVCFVPDIVTGMPHALMGMITVFTVTK